MNRVALNTSTHHNVHGQKSFEAILVEKLNEITDTTEDLNTLHYSVTKTAEEFTGTLIVESIKGKFFATAVDEDLHEVTRALSKDIVRQMKVTCSYFGSILRAM